METNAKKQMRRLDGVSPSGRRYTYLLKQELGSGNCVVYLARALTHADARPTDEELTEDNAAMRWVAVKVARGMKWKGYLTTEASLLKRLQPVPGQVRRVVRIGAEGEVLESPDTDEAMIELEHLEGVTLEQWFNETWKHQKVTPLEALDKTCTLVRQLAEALVELEGAHDGILHRDLKPANLMVTPEGLRLFDFNAAREAEGEVKTQFVGTAGYQAPEVVLSDKYDQRADLYSLGIITWELLHQRRFPANSLSSSSPTFCIGWPTEPFKGLDGSVAVWLQQLMTRLIVDQDRRIRSASEVLDILKELQTALRPHLKSPDVEVAEVLHKLDLIELLSELRPGGQNSVVADASLSDPVQRFVRERTQVHEALEDYLQGVVGRGMKDSGGTSDINAPRLLMLSGNAGDGKSYLIQALLSKVKIQFPQWRDRLTYIADATHALRPDENQSVRLGEFFAPFADNSPTPPTRFHLIAMNTGMVVRFFEEALSRRTNDPHLPDYTRLYETLQVQLGLKRAASSSKQRGDVMVVNLDLRSLVAERPGQPSFLSRMLDRVDPEPRAEGSSQPSLVALKARECEGCSARSYCPVRFNLAALSQKVPRQAVMTVLRRAALDPEIHLSPRNMWGFLYQLLTGGNRYHEEQESAETPCEEVRRRTLRGSPEDKTWLIDGHFYQILFASERVEGLWSTLRQLDPAYASIRELDQLHTRLSVQPDLDQDGTFIQDLGGKADGLLGLSLKSLLNEAGQDRGERSVAWRRDSAVRRLVMFNQAGLEAYQQDGAFLPFEALLDAYQEYSLKGPNEAQHFAESTKRALKELTELVQEVILRGYGFRYGERVFLRVSQPNPQSKSHLLVQVDAKKLKDIFGFKNLLRSDIQIDAHRDRRELLHTQGYRPRMVTLAVQNHRLMVDRDLYNFLQLVKHGQQPSAQDLAQFQTIRFAGEKLGNYLATSALELFVLERGSGDQRRLHKLYRDEYEGLNMEEVRG